MSKLAAVLVMLCLVAPAFPAARKSRPSSKKTVRTSSSAKKATSKSATAKKSTRRTASKKATSKKAASKKKGSKKSTPKRASWRGGQMQPTPERYTEIQAALVTKGYASGPATGAWTPEWAEALKRFQQDQKLEPTGKLTSLSLVALGLGPKRETAAPALNPDPQGAGEKRPIPQ